MSVRWRPPRLEASRGLFCASFQCRLFHFWPGCFRELRAAGLFHFGLGAEGVTTEFKQSGTKDLVNAAIAPLLPHNAEAERAILAAILLETTGTKDLPSDLTATEFFLIEHQIVFRHLKKLHNDGRPTNDLVLLHESLASAGELDAAGGAAYVSDILQGMPRVTNLQHYTSVVTDKAKLRRIAHGAQAILDAILCSSGSPWEVLERVDILSAQLKEDVGPKRILHFKSGADVASAEDERIEWILPGYVVRGGITELAAKVKIGKTTFLTHLARALAEGRDFLGRPTLKTPTVYLTEQPAASFRHAMERSDLLGRSDFHILSHSDTHGIPWPEVAAGAVAECIRTGAQLLIVDTLPQFACLKGDSENNSGDALDAMQPLLLAATNGIAIVLTRHERKAGGDVGDSGRGSSAFAGAVDIVLSLRRPEGNAKPTLRVLQAVSRFSETPSELLIEWTESSYICHGDPKTAALEEIRRMILDLVPSSESDALGFDEVLTTTKAPRSSLQRALKELLAEGTITKFGKGTKGSPHKYFQNIRFCPTSYIGGQKELGDAPRRSELGE
jgi:DnaB-like helicase N terminal domain/AAA domain